MTTFLVIVVLFIGAAIAQNDVNKNSSYINKTLYTDSPALLKELILNRQPAYSSMPTISRTAYIDTELFNTTGNPTENNTITVQVPPPCPLHCSSQCTRCTCICVKPRKHPAELNQVSEKIVDLKSKSNKLNSIIDVTEKNIREVSNFRADVEGAIRPAVENLIKKQNGKIGLYRQKLASLLILGDEMERLHKKVSDVRKLLVFSRGRISALRSKINDLRAADEIQTIDVSRLVASVTTEANRLQEAQVLNDKNNLTSGVISKNMDAVTSVVNKERIESFTVVLTKEHPSVVHNFTLEFVSKPLLVWGIRGMVLDKTNDENKDDALESWNFHVTVTATTTTATVSLEDKSDLWRLEKIIVNVVATLIDNSVLEYTARNPEG